MAEWDLGMWQPVRDHFKNDATAKALLKQVKVRGGEQVGMLRFVRWLG